MSIKIGNKTKVVNVLCGFNWHRIGVHCEGGSFGFHYKMRIS
jgi:hypothetical protein